MSTKTDLQRLQTIVATTDAMPILKHLPHDLHPYVYQFIADEVKVHYWMNKYDWTDTLHYLGEYYDGFQLVSSYFHYIIKDNHGAKIKFKNQNFQYIGQVENNFWIDGVNKGKSTT